MPHEEETTTTSSSDARPPILAVDMDETLIQSDTEELMPGARDALLALRDLGWKIVIWTCRTDIDKHVPEILDRHGIPYDAINENLPGVHSESRKIVFDAVVDNKNVDFKRGWDSVVKELEKRRKGWRKKGLTKATVYSIDPRTGDRTVVQEWELDKTGIATLRKGDAHALEEFDLDVLPDKGVLFLKNLQESIQHTYLFVEV